MSLRNVDFDAAFRRIADKRIEEAMAEGKFDRLAGAGQDIVLEPLPADENARMMWWALKIMKQNNFTPDEVVWRKAVDHLRDAIDRLTDESLLESLVTKLNGLAHQINTLGTNAINLPVAPMELDAERQRLRTRLEKR